MYRLTASLRSIARSHSKWRESQHGISGRPESFETFAATIGHGSSPHAMRPMMSSAQSEILKALRLGERSRASSLLSEIGEGNSSLTSNDFLPILEHCARSPDPLFVMETWRIMREEEIDVDEKCYSLIIRALCKGGYIEEAFNLMNTLRGSCDFIPVLPMFNDILGGCARSQSLSRASECLDLMECQMVGKNEITYTELLKLAVSQQNLSAVHEIWKEYVKYYSPNLISLKKFVSSFSLLGDLEAAHESLQKMMVLALRKGFVLSKTHGGRLSIPRLDIPMPSCMVDLRGFDQDNEYSEFITSRVGEKLETHINKNELGSKIFPGQKDVKDDVLRTGGKFYDRVRKILRWSFNDMIHACARKSNCWLAEQLFAQMQDLGLEPSPSTYDGFIKAVVAERGFHDGVELLLAMQQKNLKPCDSTLATTAIACSKALNLDLAETLLNQISRSPNTRPFNYFLEACDTLDRPERALRALAKMKEMKLKPDIRTYELLFSLFGSCNAPYEESNMLSRADAAKRINAIEMDMVKNSIQHSQTSMKNLLKALGAEELIGELIQYLSVAENQFSRGCSCLSTSAYNLVLHTLVEAKESQKAIKIFKFMKSCHFQPDAATYDIMLHCCRNLKSFMSACALVSVMIRIGFYPKAHTYTALMMILLDNEDIDGASKLLEQAHIEGVHPDVVLYNTILRAASDQGRIDITELIVERMHRNQIQPDSSTCYFVFSTYVDLDYMNTAIEALQVLSMRMISLEDNILEEKRIEFENYIFADDSEADSCIIELFEDYQEHLAVAMLHLRWCATLGFQISWLPNQSLWAKRLSSDYERIEGSLA